MAVVLMAAAEKLAPRPYDLLADFERALATALCSRPRLWGRLGEAVDPDCLAVPEAQLALQAARAIAADTAHPPDRLLVVLQRLRRWMYEGKVTGARMRAVSDMFDAAEDGGLPEDVTLVGEIVPILQRRMQLSALEEGFSEWQKRGEPERAIAPLERAKTLGRHDVSLGSLLSVGTFDSIERVRHLQRLQTCILELDLAIGGGIVANTFSVFLGATGAGKSIMLGQLASASALQGCFTGIVTLELDVPTYEARVVANLTGFTIDEIITNTYDCGAIEAMEGIFANGLWGGITFKHFTARVTSIAEIDAWVKDEESARGRKMNTLIIDYADKCTTRAKSGKESTSYQVIGEVYQELFDYAADTQRWVFTGSQVKGGAAAKQGQSEQSKRRRLATDDAADSQNKVRVADLVVALNVNAGLVSFGIEKNRRGPGQVTTVEIPTDFPCARIAPVSYGSIQGK